MKATHILTEKYDTRRKLANRALKAMNDITGCDNGTIRNPYELASCRVKDGRTLIEAIYEDGEVMYNDGWYIVEVDEYAMYVDVTGLAVNEMGVNDYEIISDFEEEQETNKEENTMKTNKLSYTASKNYVENGATYRIDVKIQLADECKNGVCHWSVTADIYEERRNGRSVNVGGGCYHDDILKHFPEFSKFVALHLCDCHGAPLYAVENGFYLIGKESKEKVMDYLRVTEEEYNALHQSEDKQYFKYLLYTMGIVNRWNEEASEAVKELESLTGNEWENPYEYDKERKHITAFTDEEASEMNKKIDSGYYTPEAMKERKEEAARKAYEKKRAEIIAECEKEVSKLEEEKTVKLYILDSGLPVDNVIYYEHKKKVVFNWLDYKDNVSQEDFIDFLNSVDYSKLPEGITFNIK